MTDSTPLNHDEAGFLGSDLVKEALPTQRHLGEEEFIEEFDPQQKPSGDLFDFKDVQGLDYRFVWTIVESGDDEDPNWYASPGFHVVNTIGYVTSGKPWTDDIAAAVWFDASGFERDEDDERPDYDIDHEADERAIATVMSLNAGRPYLDRLVKLHRYIMLASEKGVESWEQNRDRSLWNAVEQVNSVTRRLSEIAIKLESAGASQERMDRVFTLGLDLIDEAIIVLIGEQP